MQRASPRCRVGYTEDAVAGFSPQITAPLSVLPNSTPTGKTTLTASCSRSPTESALPAPGNGNKKGTTAAGCLHAQCCSCSRGERCNGSFSTLIVLSAIQRPRSPPCLLVPLCMSGHPLVGREVRRGPLRPSRDLQGAPWPLPLARSVHALLAQCWRESAGAARASGCP